MDSEILGLVGRHVPCLNVRRPREQRLESVMHEVPCLLSDRVGQGTLLVHSSLTSLGLAFVQLQAQGIRDVSHGISPVAAIQTRILIFHLSSCQAIGLGAGI